MLQFIAQKNDHYPLVETIKIALDGGCRWIQLNLSDMSDEDIRAIASDIIKLCKEAASFLTIEDHTELAKELSLHGVHIKNITDRSAGKIREELGPEAVIGVDVASAAAVMALRSSDIDYVTLPADMPLDEIAEFVITVRDAGIETPIVATGDITPDDALVYLATGVSGIATGRLLIEASDPVEEVKLMLKNLSGE